MGVKALWQVSATGLALLIVANLMLSGAGETAWLVLGLLLLAAVLFYCFRQGENVGFGASGISNTIEEARRAGEQVYRQLDKKYLSQAFDPRTGFKGVLAGALVPYASGAVYIILSLLSRSNPDLSTAATAARVPAWLLSLPYWPIWMQWHETFLILTPDIAAMLLITPFILPLFTFAGYLQGPRLWRHAEEAMRQGRRRAKARARVGKELAPKLEKPEI